MIISSYKSYDGLPLFLNAVMVAMVLGVSPSSGYELMHEVRFPVLKVGSRMVVPKEKFREWVEQHMGGRQCVEHSQKHYHPPTSSFCCAKFSGSA